MAAPARRPSAGVRTPSLASVIGLVIVLAGLVLGTRPIHDNSFLTHLATGRLILDTGHIPHSDPYTFTAAGQEWVVQSWLPSLLYGLVERIAGESGLLILTGLLVGAVAGMLWALSRPATMLVGRLALVATTVAVGTWGWGPRPLMIGLALFGLTLLAAEGRLSPVWLVPAYWVWVNSHGSFPLGLLALGLLAAGRSLDDDAPSIELRALRFGLIGTVLGALNPLGPRLLVFPLELLRRQDVLRTISEWRAPTFEGWGQRGFLVLVAMTIVILARRPSWRAALPAAVFIPLALLSARNLSVASMVLVPVLAPAITRPGMLTGAERRPILRPVMVVLVALAGLVLAAAPGRDAFALDAYPVAAVQHADDQGLIGGDAQVLAPDYVGNYLEVKYGAGARSFIDDRYDMFPDELITDYGVLLSGGEGWQEILERYEITTVIWRIDEPLAQLLKASGEWDVTYHDDNWLVALPR